MIEPASVAVEEGPQIVHPVFEHGEAVDAHAEGEALPLDQAPTIPEPLDLPPGAGALMDLLKVLLKFKCDTNQVAQKLIATVPDLEAIAADDNADVAALRGWRREIFGNDALRLKAGEIALAAGSGLVRIVEVVPEGEANDEAAE